MKVGFKTRKLQSEYQHSQKAIQSYGTQVARKYIQRVDILKQATGLDEVKRLPGLNCHPLKGTRKGQWAVKLTGFYRLIFTVSGEQLNVARIEEVSKHYGD
ncbi:MAG: plasmid maintenance system killer [Verrucomicrobia bacterium]|jgi:toxin HigB-1|nr:plasmid maintenance system killer [Verrucomicrobiota bacterium]MBT7066575.1 plasmid maintenance system killer [Verrucomicrobiota bacterium]MBT7702094.1 plasmid maintenance system killer [Verrucomicrobiota bacterium]